jgi:hypothetical protein
MTKYVTTDGHGRPTGFFDSAIAAPPAGAQLISQAQYNALISAPATTTFIAGALGSFTPAVDAVPMPSIAAVIALRAGLAVTSTAHAAALNGTYALDGLSLTLAAELAGLINANSGAFPGNASTWSWPDSSGALHVFPSGASFVAFHQAIAAYRLALYAVIWGAASELPAASAEIA